ncbi:ribosomal protein S18 acetylase RimI-like enzyme [Microbacterium terrae]|uniref:Acetyltransferase (GNAT) family protein n=1 Tax=Microbacterium terrae TaxID=69369 RepID=A0A0M2GX70_9MICO|nr:GNAT family N-acetyltransferase [Microbacterium terrae]KJL38349.1 Acetyltransferase (GNAT) family protein [Microbacterium terrae]MBP1079010.1 ribosomal protein S18 acetylase RimI-like enzyme [Microbacterium terrae]GLJ98410.1 N-acetyltransferase [Microbacterium terrae]
MSFTTRPPVLQDAAAIADLHVSTWREAYAHLLPDDFFSEEYVAGRHRMWNHVLTDAREDMTVRIVESDGAIIGFAWVGPGIGLDGEEPPRERQLYAIYVSAAHYGTGAGQALLDETLGDGPAMLWVAKENPRASAFYLRNGFRFDGVEQIDPYAPLITDARMVR